MSQEEKIDIFDPGIIVAILIAVVGDAGMAIGVLAFAIPVIGIVIAGFAIIAHYLSAIIVIAIFWRHIRGWLACLALILAGILPLPLLTIGIVAAILLSNKVIAFIAEQALIQTVAVFTAGAGEALEGAAAAETAATVAEGTVEAGKTVTAGVETTEGAVRGEEAARATEGAGSVRSMPEMGDVESTPVEESSKPLGHEGDAELEKEMETPEERAPGENLQQELFEPSEGEMSEPESETSEPGKGEKIEDSQQRENDTTKRLRKAFEKAQKVKQQFKKLRQPENVNEEDEEENNKDDDIDLPLAA